MEPIIIVLATCISETINIPYTNYKFDREDFGFVVVGIDLIVVFSIVIFIQYVYYKQQDYIEEYNNQTI